MPEPNIHWELEKNKFYLSYNQEAVRLNELKQKYANTPRFEQTDKNLNQMLESFETAETLIQSMQTQITLLQIQVKMFHQDYMNSLDSEINLVKTLLNKPPVG